MQRAGRAGRVRAGICWKLYQKSFMEESVPLYTLPEILRTPLEEVLLSVLILDIGHPMRFLASAVQPPDQRAVVQALRNLIEMEAVKVNEGTDKLEREFLLTPLGFHLASLPMDPKLGKMLISAAVLDCLDPLLTVAAALSSKSPFISPFGKQEDANRAKMR